MTSFLKNLKEGCSMKLLCAQDLVSGELAAFLRGARNSGTKISKLDYENEVFEIGNADVVEVLLSGEKPMIATERGFFEAIKITEDGIPERYRLESDPFRVLVVEEQDGIVATKEAVIAKPGQYLLVAVYSPKMWWQERSFAITEEQTLFDLRVVDKEVLQRWYTKLPIDTKGIEGEVREFYICEQRPVLAYQVGEVTLMFSDEDDIPVSILVDGIAGECEDVILPKYAVILVDPFEPSVMRVMTQTVFDAEYEVAFCDDTIRLF